jgi:chromosome segregation ATPase
MEALKHKEQYQPSEEELKAIEESKNLHNEGVQQTQKEALEKQLVGEGKASYVIDKEGKQTINLTKEEIEETKNQERSEKESVSKNEKPKIEIFKSKQNQDAFKQLGTATIETVSSVYKNVKGGFVDRYRASRNNKLYNHQREKVATLENDVALKKRAVEQAEADIKTHDTRMYKLNDQFGGLTPKAMEEVLKEKKKLEKKLKNANYEEKELIAEQVFSKKKLKKYEEKRSKIIEGIELFVNEKTEPYKERVSELKENTTKLDEEINSFISKRDVFENQLNELKNQFRSLKNSNTGVYESERTMYTDRIKEVDTEYNNIDDIIKSVVKEKSDLNTKIGKLENKINYWNNVAETAKTDNISKQEEEPETEAVPTENLEGNEDWYEAVMPSKEKLNEYGKTKEWYEASGLSKKDMENVTNAEIKETTPEEKAGVEVNENSENNDESDEEKENENESKEGLKDIESQMNKYKDQWNKLFGKKLPLNETNFSRRNVITTVALLRTNFLGQRIELGRLIEDAVIRENDRQPISTRIEMAELAGMFEKMRKEKNLFHTYIHSGNVNKEAA